jgi:GrpB-like predicted nucleotidyltransferase (UPF0157 family)
MDLCSLLIPFIILEAIGYTILSPVLNKGAKLGIPRQFSLADFVVLLCYVQLVMALTYYFRQLFNGSVGLGVMMTVMGLTTVVLWGAAISTLNQLELHNLLRRNLFLLVLLPGVVGVMGGLPIALLLAAQSIRFENSFVSFLWFFGGLGGGLLLAIGLRYLGSWLMKDAKDLNLVPTGTIVGGNSLPKDPHLWPTVMVVDYDPTWPQVFESLRARVLEAVNSFAISVEHVGSTAVPGLAAKPIIDIGVVVPSNREVAMAIARLEAIGYVHRGDLGIKGREAFRSPEGSPQHHLYVYVRGNTALANHLAVRDHLRQYPSVAAAYGQLKQEMARKFPGDIEGYCDGKTDFLLSILRAAGFSAEELAAIEQANRKK